MIQMFLRERAWDVIPTFNGHEAVKAWEAEGVDLILMDVQMPKMDGLEATRVIRELERTTETHTPIIALTAHARREDETLCRQAGMDDFVTKPVSRERLYKIVEQYV